MNAAFLHLSLTHFPVIGFVLFTPLFIYAVWKKKQEWIRLFSLVFVVLALIGIVVFNSGEGAEEIIEHSTTISHSLIHEHEEAGEFAFWLFSICGLAGALVLALKLSIENSRHRMLLWIFSLVLLMSSVAALRTAHLGGKIRHPEMENTVSGGQTDEVDDD